MSTRDSKLCRYLDWDSKFFGYRIAQANVFRLNAQRMQELLSWCTGHSIDCLYILAEANDRETVHLLEKHNFRFVDIRLTLECNLCEMDDFPENLQSPWLIRPSLEEDIPALRAIARSSHRDSRFYFDDCFPTHLVDALYETWIERSCNGYADIVWVAELQGQPVGYISCHVHNGSYGQIGLLGVDAAWRGRGVGRGLLRKALRWFGERGVSCVNVVTQGRNIRAQRLYARHGFLVQSVQLWYHRWFLDDSTEA